MTRILIVEDQPDIRKLVRMTLDFDEYELHEAADGESGLAMMNELDPDIVLLDVMMPGLDGLEVCKRIRENPRTQDKAVVLLTARAQQADIKAGREAGASDYLVKPFSPLELVEKIDGYANRLAPRAWAQGA